MQPMTAAERVQAALDHREGDRVPFLLSLTLHGARELGLGIRDYFSDPRNPVEAQLRMRRRYGHDGLVGSLYGALEYEAWGGEVVFAEDGPPNSGAPILRNAASIDTLEPPRVQDCPGLQRALQVLRGLRERAGSEVPVLGCVISPFSLPVMQLGFEAYLDLLFLDRPRFWRLMAVNEAYTVAWGRAQLDAGATALAYSDPLASPDMLPPPMFEETGFRVAQHTLAALGGPVLTHLASGRCLGVVDLLARTGTLGVGASCRDDLSELKAACSGRLAVVGNLNGIAMASWTPAQAEAAVRDALARGGSGGGFILSDNHGEIPWAVPETVLEAVAEAALTWGTYPLRIA